MGKRIGTRGEKIMIEPGDNPWKIAVECVADGRRWPELVAANPSKARSESGSFVTLMPGEVLTLPGTWLQKMGGLPVTPIVMSPGASEVGALNDAGSSPPPRATTYPFDEQGNYIGPPELRRNAADAAGTYSLPYGWSESDLEIVVGMARGWKMPPEDLMAIWFSESGAQPRCRSIGAGCVPANQPLPDGYIHYFGLIMGGATFVDPTLGWKSGTWEHITQKESIAVQLQAIAQFWDRLQKIYLGESATARAERIGVSTASVVYALNFVPAYAKRATGPNSVLVKRGDIVNGRDLYEDNKGLDLDHDGAITMADMEARVVDRRNALASGGPGRTLYLAVKDTAGGSVPSLATLWAPISGTWEDLTGKSPIVTVGFGGSSGTMGPGQRGAGFVETLVIAAALAAAVYYGAPHVAKIWKA